MADYRCGNGKINQKVQAKIGKRHIRSKCNENRMDTLSDMCNKSRNKMRADTELKNYHLYCPKCKQETLIDVKNLQVTVIKEPDA